MNRTARVQVFDAAPTLSNALTERLRARGFNSCHHAVPEESDTELPPSGNDLAVVLVDGSAVTKLHEQLSGLLRRLVKGNVATLVLGDAETLRRDGGPLVEWVGPDVALDEVVAKIGTLSRYAPLVKGLQRELDHLLRLGEQLNRYFGEIDQEMRLAGRLQGDFLPRELPQIPPYHFEILYRPASWVSGDMYDVFRVDEHHLGVFIADAMGHGVAAGLLTMFLRQALRPKQINGSDYRIVPPSEVLGLLHECLLRQRLPNSQFVTAVYGLLETETGVLTLARAGHPYPLVVDPSGSVREVRSNGSLLGLADVPSDFEETQVTIGADEKLVLYTDGVEELIVVPGSDVGDTCTYTDMFQQLAKLSAADFTSALGQHLDTRAGSLHPADDITLVLLERRASP